VARRGAVRGVDHGRASRLHPRDRPPKVVDRQIARLDVPRGHDLARRFADAEPSLDGGDLVKLSATTGSRRSRRRSATRVRSRATSRTRRPRAAFVGHRPGRIPTSTKHMPNDGQLVDAIAEIRAARGRAPAHSGRHPAEMFGFGKLRSACVGWAKGAVAPFAAGTKNRTQVGLPELARMLIRGKPEIRRLCPRVGWSDAGDLAHPTTTRFGFAK